MTVSPIKKFRHKLKHAETVFGLWVSLESPTITEIAARLGFDFIMVDAEHSHLGDKEVMEHLRIANLSGMVGMVHIPEIQAAVINRVLDLGADGFLAPQVRSAEEVALAIRYAKYPPDGVRGIGAQRSTRWGKGFRERVRRANAEVMVIPMIETVEAAESVDSILDVPGVDAIFFGPADYSAANGYAGEWEGPGTAQKLLNIQKRARQRGVACGVLATDPENIRLRLRQKFQIVALGSDTGMLIRAAIEARNAAGVPVPKNAWK